MKVSEYAALDATGLAQLVREKEVSPLEVLEAAVAAIEQVDPAVHAVVERTYEFAKEQIQAGIDLEAPFCGVPFVIDRKSVV